MKRLIGLSALFLATLGCGSGAATPPAAPTNFATSILSGGIHMTWTDSSQDETMFMIERKDPGGQFVDAYTVPFNITQYHDTANLKVGSTYSYRVRAMSDKGGLSGYSNESSTMLK